MRYKKNGAVGNTAPLFVWCGIMVKSHKFAADKNLLMCYNID